MDSNNISNSKEKNGAGKAIESDKDHFLKLAAAKMPFGKYAGRLLVDLPEDYVIWFSRKGFPQGELGRMLREIYEIKVNGLEHLFAPFRTGRDKGIEPDKGDPPQKRRTEYF